MDFEKPMAIWNSLSVAPLEFHARAGVVSKSHFGFPTPSLGFGVDRSGFLAKNGNQTWDLSKDVTHKGG